MHPGRPSTIMPTGHRRPRPRPRVVVLLGQRVADRGELVLWSPGWWCCAATPTGRGRRSGRTRCRGSGWRSSPEALLAAPRPKDDRTVRAFPGGQATQKNGAATAEEPRRTDPPNREQDKCRAPRSACLSSLNARLSAVTSAFVQVWPLVRRWRPGPVAWRRVGDPGDCRPGSLVCPFRC